MPCDCSHMHPRELERESQLVCQHLVYVYRQLGRAVPSWVRKAANDIYGCEDRADEVTEMLCTLCGKMTKARSLANWWDDHQEADRQKERAAKKAADKQVAKAYALKKLSPADKQALGL